MLWQSEKKERRDWFFLHAKATRAWKTETHLKRNCIRKNHAVTWRDGWFLSNVPKKKLEICLNMLCWKQTYEKLKEIRSVFTFDWGVHLQSRLICPPHPKHSNSCIKTWTPSSWTIYAQRIPFNCNHSAEDIVIWYISLQIYITFASDERKAVNVKFNCSSNVNNASKVLHFTAVLRVYSEEPIWLTFSVSFTI